MNGDDERTTVLEQQDDLMKKEEDKQKSFETRAFAEDQEPPEVAGSKAGTFKPKPMTLYIGIAVLVLALVVMAYFLFFKDSGKGEVSSQVHQMQELTQQVQDLESNVKEKQDEIFELTDEVKKKTGEDSVGVNTLNLNEDEEKLLKQRISEEKDVSVKSLLEEILEKNSEIQEMKEKVAEIEKLLPKPHIVSAGENHYQIAMDFLVNEKNVEKKRAIELVERTAVFDTLVPGFKVWNFYSGDEYGTSVTQGTAVISPNTLIRRAKKKLVDARDQAISERDELSDNIKTLEEKRNRIIAQLDTLSKEKESLINKVGDLNEQVNSLFYLMDSERSLKKKGILKGGFLKSTKLKDVSPEHFTSSVDLRYGTQIAVSASELGLGKIKSITIYPKFLKKGTDYNVRIDGDKQNAAVTIMNAAKLKNERIVISVK